MALDPVVTHSSRCIQGLSNLLISDLRQIAGFGSVVRPDACQTVRLEFCLNRFALWPCGVRTPRIAKRTGEILHVMAIFMSQYVRLGEWATLRAKAREQFIEEVEVKIDTLVFGTVERPYGSGSISTSR